MKQGILVNGRVKILMKNRTTLSRPRRLGPKRVSSLRQAFALRKKDDPTKYVVRREIKVGEKTRYKSPNVQRLVTATRLRRKAVLKRNKQQRWKASKENAQAYEKILSKYLKEKKAAAKKEAAAKQATTPTTK